LPVLDLREETRRNFSELLLLARAEEKKRGRMIALVAVDSESRKGPVVNAKEFRLGPKEVGQTILGFSFARKREGGYYEYSKREEGMVPSSHGVNFVEGQASSTADPKNEEAATRLFMNEKEKDDIRLLLASLPVEEPAR
jgi:hypothetical protein